jgi:hypothetical protein
MKCGSRIRADRADRYRLSEELQPSLALSVLAVGLASPDMDFDEAFVEAIQTLRSPGSCSEGVDQTCSRSFSSTSGDCRPCSARPRAINPSLEFQPRDWKQDRRSIPLRHGVDRRSANLAPLRSCFELREPNKPERTGEES